MVVWPIIVSSSQLVPRGVYLLIDIDLVTSRPVSQPPHRGFHEPLSVGSVVQVVVAAVRSNSALR
jgi:hypothetical protein